MSMQFTTLVKIFTKVLTSPGFFFTNIFNINHNKLQQPLFGHTLHTFIHVGASRTFPPNYSSVIISQLKQPTAKFITLKGQLQPRYELMLNICTILQLIKAITILWISYRGSSLKILKGL
jgi:hypothetical protein